MFAQLEEQRERWGVQSYTISQPSLEQIFLRFAREQQAEDVEVAGGGEGGEGRGTAPARVVAPPASRIN
jgi:hypothetical protein